MSPRRPQPYSTRQNARWPMPVSTLWTFGTSSRSKRITAPSWSGNPRRISGAAGSILNTIPRYAQPLPRKPMARIHAHRKGKSGSTRPYLKTNPEWVVMEKAEIEETIVRLHQEGLSTASIGVRLRDAYGVPNVHLATGRSVTEILSSKGTKFTLPEDLASLIKRAASLQSHLKDHRKDLSNRRGLELIESRIRRLSRYYKSRGVLPADWDFSLKLAELQVK